MARVKTLRFEVQSQLLAKVAQLADQCGWYSGALQAAGYRSFLAGEEFDRSFCEAKELEEHKQCQIESMKKLIETPDGILLRQSDRESKIEADPCLRRLRRTELEDRITVEKRRSEMYAKLMSYRANELSQHTDQNVRLARENYALYFGSTLAEVFRSVEFQPDGFRSAPEFPVISKPLGPDWDICWSPESNRTLRWLPRERSDDAHKMSTLDLRCYVRSKGAKGFVYIPIGFKALNLMVVRIQHLVRGFGWAYSFFNGVEELRTVLAAHANLYALVGSDVEDILARALKSI